MNVLLLINGAPHHRQFYRHVGHTLERLGHEAHYAVDSHFTDYLYPDAPLPPERTRYFSEFFARNYDSSRVPPEFSDVNLWRAVFPDLDRAEYSTTLRRKRPDYYLRLVENLVAFFCKLIDENKIDCIVYESVSNALSYVAYLVAKKRGVRYIGFGMSRIPARFDFTDQQHYRHSRTRELFKAILAGEVDVPAEAREAALEYIANLDAKRPDYVTANHGMTGSPFARYARWDAPRNYLRAVRYYLEQREDFEFAYQVSNPIIVYPEHFARETARWLRGIRLRKRHYQKPDLSRDYFIYPLQYHPESSCAVDGVYFNDDLTNVLNIANSLPIGIQLYVKDHPYADAQAPMALYERLERIPNVTLIEATFDSKKLIRSAKAVVTSTSTLGFEAVLLGKPVFVMGNPFYDFHPLVQRLSTWDKAFEQLSRYTEIKCEPREIQAFVEAYFLSSGEGTYNLGTSYDDPNLAERVARVILKEVTPSRPTGLERHGDRAQR